MKRHVEYEDEGIVELSVEESERYDAMIEQAERDVFAAKAGAQVRVNFRWGREQLAVVKRAAEIKGIAYQAYLKEAVYRCAVADVKDAQSMRDEEYADNDTTPESGLSNLVHLRRANDK